MKYIGEGSKTNEKRGNKERKKAVTITKPNIFWQHVPLSNGDDVVKIKSRRERQSLMLKNAICFTRKSRGTHMYPRDVHAQLTFKN